ncbi:hypothetical protein SAMN02982929_00889 [Saccharopolyspora kobensis]|uniref:Uncharacterized protein n=1 Tax=Saccharopolyspora kobensis TaxID=146035 RepID=A0A1H5VIN9_9PSEU|nr:hypothetical protein [Saccharopolyspora kobensis]SEF86916.1 hypothetical protein SAMN02982929_00889 [Saccharopolyspora kobensis]SFC60517.1 hypothetical protein SAMN05216506_1011181 [Saccharopolyspora kobensis]
MREYLSPDCQERVRSCAAEALTADDANTQRVVATVRVKYGLAGVFEMCAYFALLGHYEGTAPISLWDADPAEWRPELRSLLNIYRFGLAVRNQEADAADEIFSDVVRLGTGELNSFVANLRRYARDEWKS